MPAGLPAGVVLQVAALDRYGTVTATNGTWNTLDCNRLPSPFVAAGAVHTRVSVDSSRLGLSLSLYLSLSHTLSLSLYLYLSSSMMLFY